MLTPFLNRRAAGRRLAELLSGYASQPDTLVLGLSRGGVPVAFEVARALSLPLDVFVVRKLGLPHNEEVAFGAIATGSVRVLNNDLIEVVGLGGDDIERITAREQRELARREREYRGGAPAMTISNKTVIIVDDGLATGASMTAAITAIRAQHAHRIVVAVPVAAADASRTLGDLADKVVSVLMPEPFDAVGRWYIDFSQTSDDEVGRLLRLAQPRLAPRAAT